MADQSNDFYQELREKMKKWLESEGKSSKWANYLMLAPDLFHLLCKLSIDKDVPVKEKAKLAAAIAYFVSPLDLLPEAIVGPVGYADDIALAAYVLNSIVNNSDPATVRKHWAGGGDVLDLIQQILKVADEMVGSGLWKKLRGLA
ncbi:MAG: YkvA family protein [Candidatus Binatia bacterium]